MTALKQDRFRVGAILSLLAGLFAFDIYTPLGFATHFLYATVILLSTGSPVGWMPWAAAGIGTCLTVVGAFLCTPWPGLPLWIPIGNRTFTITILWVLAWFGVKRRQAETQLVTANEHLEEKVAARTHELAQVNRALVSEITERMQAEQAFRLSQGRLAGILDLAEDAIIVIKEDRSIALFNQGAVKLFGYGSDEILGEPIDRLLPAPLWAVNAQIPPVGVKGDSSDRAAHPHEVVGLRKNGRVFGRSQHLDTDGRRQDDLYPHLKRSDAPAPDGTGTAILNRAAHDRPRRGAAEDFTRAARRYQPALGPVGDRTRTDGVPIPPPPWIMPGWPFSRWHSALPRSLTMCAAWPIGFIPQSWTISGSSRP